MKIKFKQWDCILQPVKYNNDRTALQLVDVEDGGPIAMATVNMPDQPLADDEVYIKSWSENEGMAEALMKADVIGPVLGKVRSSWVVATRHKLLIKNSAQ
jgi:hypothetical protein